MISAMPTQINCFTKRHLSQRINLNIWASPDHYCYVDKVIACVCWKLIDTDIQTVWQLSICTAESLYVSICMWYNLVRHNYYNLEDNIMLLFFLHYLSDSLILCYKVGEDIERKIINKFNISSNLNRGTSLKDLN